MGTLLSRFIFFLFGWTLDDKLKADFTRCVMIAAPHTSNWDFVFARAAFFLLGIPIRYTVKDSWTKFPMSLLMNPLGAIGIDRSPRKPGEQRRSMTDAMIDLFKEKKELVVMVTPEGTRSKRTKWKTGFYYVAAGANVPIALGYLDYKNKVAGVGKIIYPSGDMNKDLREIMQFYKDIPPKHPEKFSIDMEYA